ncbi:hypothetical protein Val02_52620 [Virgisporangium aliadipatigenens]|uniref:Periplasmic binding protein domain-containing protein n=1 Tax=Virgisporangium aliadipatigenens TaxID=741659 RepID=A0A8J3YNA6_9ACTN|nr:sugar ABC transporter substrate-binding protein [Virgisporangium aliadipatigenens]GIJ48376.1 hypothetical protein Val02_52620 [Virgisporangium aliadipatigenens]
MRILTSAAMAVMAVAGLCGISGAAAPPLPHAPVALLAVNMRQPFVQELAEGFATGVEDIGRTAHVQEGPEIGDPGHQVELLRGYRTAPPSGLAVFTQSPELLAAPLAETTAAGVPVLAVACAPAVGSGVRLFVGNDNYRLGRLLAGQVAARLPRDTSGVIVLGANVPGMPTIDKRVNGVRDELRERFPNARVLGPFDTKMDPTANREAWEVLLAANPDAVAFLGTGEADGRNLAALRQERHATWVAGSFGVDMPLLLAVRSGDLSLVSPEHFLQGAIAGRLQALQARVGVALPRGWIEVPGLVVDRGNVDAVIDRQTWLFSRQNWFRPQVDDIVTDPGRHLRPLSDASV